MNSLFNKFLNPSYHDKLTLSTFSGDYTGGDIANHTEKIISFINKQLDIENKRIVVLMPNLFTYFSTVLAVNKLGGIVIPLSMQYRKDDFLSVLSFVDPHAVITSPDYQDGFFSKMIYEWSHSMNKETTVFYLDEEEKCWEYYQTTGVARPNETEDVEIMFFTTGSTGLPKGLVSHCTEVENFANTYIEIKGLSEKDSLFLNPPPTSLIGIGAFIAALKTGARIAFPEQFDIPKMVKLIEHTTSNTIDSTPSIFKALYSFGKHIDSEVFRNIEVCTLSGEMINEGYIDHFELMKECMFVGVYGLSEVGGVLTCNLRESLEWRIVNGVSTKFREEQGMKELAVKTPVMFRGYYRQPELTREILDDEQWFYTGDLVEVSDNGTIKIIGRKKDLIKKGGQQVVPSEVEKVISTHDKVKQVAVIGAPHPVFGEQVVAFIVPNGILNVQEVYSYCAKRIASYKVPDQIQTIPELPSIQSKVDKLSLRKVFIEQTNNKVGYQHHEK
ncbi:class I adenylate-forming enzyme family protein [Bacillus sp. Marseille-P3661]|uniref:class I adenylate-forming enzyme family protein n=1 Tax=Bacillus sp. Marseille-P3661 TaxID=1936234 RepID=UPI0015E197B3|nr:class I adenylate-forming enzyme family protein [Bacillus sp. Marseille-P3661]